MQVVEVNFIFLFISNLYSVFIYFDSLQHYTDEIPKSFRIIRSCDCVINCRESISFLTNYSFIVMSEIKNCPQFHENFSSAVFLSKIKETFFEMKVTQFK